MNEGIPVIQFDITKMHLDAGPRKLKDGCRFYGSDELLKNIKFFEESDVPYNDTTRNPGCLTKLDDLKIGDIVYNRWYDETIKQGKVINIDGIGGTVEYNEDLRGFIEFSKDDRECWCQHTWSACSSEINLNAELDNIIKEEVGGELADTTSKEMTKKLDQQIIRTI